MSILPLLQKTHESRLFLQNISTEEKRNVLYTLSEIILQNTDNIILENQKDLDLKSDSDPKKDRLLLNKTRIEALAASVKNVAQLPDPTGVLLIEKKTYNGLIIKKITVPLGVIGVIYESRPNVTIDVAALGLLSGNAVVLRGGSEAWNTNVCLVKSIHEALQKHDFPTDLVALMPPERELLVELLSATSYVDVIIPRGSEALIQYVRQHSLIPTIETGAGVCHTYIHQSANLEMAKNIVINAKTTRPSVCNSLDTIIIDFSVLDDFLPLLLTDFISFKVEVFADEPSYFILKKLKYPFLQHLKESDFSREYLDFKCGIKTVQHAKEALLHIEKYSSKHSECVVCEELSVAEDFLKRVDAAAVYHNASTRFTDGEVFGLGAEIGISTQKLHARGPFALEKLVTEKWIIIGEGQIRK